MDYFAEIADERRLAASFLVTLSDEQLATPSLCEGWTVRDVAAHLLMPLVTPMARVTLALVRSGMNFDRANLALTATVASRGTDEIVAGLRQRAASKFTPPGLGPAAPLTDLLVHGQDMRRPLGLTRMIPVERQIVALDFLTSGSRRVYVPSSRLTGLAFRAADIDWAAGEGEEVSGPAEALMMAIAGRPDALEDLEGPGTDALRARIKG